LQQVVANAQSESNLAFSVGSELEFTLFDAQTRQPVDKTNFCESRTLNQREQFLSSLYDQLQLQEIEVEQLHAESAPGQVEIVLRYCQDPVELADRLVLARETISQLARSHGMLAIFLPKIFPTKAGNGNHLHISVREASTGTNLFSPTPGSASTSDTTLPPPLVRKSADDIHPVVQSFLEGILCHLPTLLALTLPTANSFRRVGPGCWTGSTLSWAFNDKESPLRIVPNLERGIWDHVEYKLMDSLANPYLALAAILIAGLDGVTQEYQLRPPSGGPKGADAPSATDLPQSIGTSLDQLEANRLFQERLSRPLLRAYVACRRAECQDDQDKTLDDEVRRALQLAL
jgi:glutamine synthetase